MQADQNWFILQTRQYQQGSQGLAGPPGPPGGPEGPKGSKGDASQFGQFVFSVYKSTGSAFDGLITYDIIVLCDNLLDSGTGVFTCSVSGTYFFTFSGLTGSKGIVIVNFYVNDGLKIRLRDNNNEVVNSNLSFTWTYLLEAGDKVKLQVDTGKLVVDSTHRIYWNGFLIKAP